MARFRKHQREVACRGMIERMTKLYAIIRKGSQPVADGMAVELEVSRRTIQRDIEFLRDRIGLPIFFDYERNCWTTDRAAKLPWWLED